jgi:3D (Asp-Asp-Asp) domain-containing protein
MKNPKQLLGISIIATLILSNAILGNEYSKDMKKYESTVNNHLKLIKQLKVSDSKDKQLINQKVNEINSKNTEINNLNTQLDQVKKENDDLKKQLAQRKEVTIKQRTLTIEASAYTANCKGCSGRTAIGYNVNSTTEYNGYRIIATDPSVIPLYSVVEIETEYNTFKAVAIDTGGAIKGNKIDLLVNTYSEAIQFGRQDVTVTILN